MFYIVINYNISIQTKVEKISKNSEVIKMQFILKFQVIVIHRSIQLAKKNFSFSILWTSFKSII